MPATFRGRLTASMTALSIGVLALASTLVYAGIRWALVRNLDEALLALARTEIASAFDEPGGLVHVHDEAPLDVGLGNGVAYEKASEILNAQREVVARTGNLFSGAPLELDETLLASALAGEAGFGNAERDDVRYRAIYHPFDDADGARYAMVVAISRRPLELTLEVVAAVLLAALALAGGLAAVVSSRVARRLTRPLDRIARTARDIGESSLGTRIPEVSHDAELHALVGLLNDMLSRLDAAFETQRRFVADASHELRSPLANLRGTVEVALRHPRSADEYRETLAVALAEIERLSRLVHSLLTLTRAGAGRLAIDRRSVDLADVAARAVEAYTARAAARGVRLRLEAGAPATVQGDADRLREVVDNLLDNAVRVAPAGSTVRLAVEHADGRCAVEVVDAGPGLTEDEQTLVFEPFARGSAAGGDGAGLGLAIARAIAEAHGGRIAVRSTPGAGATFRFELPADGGWGAAPAQ
ncbi:MAG: ATP-binding protein [Thermodesulfobacteriota bacterium]